MELRIGDRVRLLSGGCPCELCDEARSAFLVVKGIYGVNIILENQMEYPIGWTWEVEPMSLENE